MQRIGLLLILLAVAMTFAVADDKAGVRIDVQINDKSSAVDEGVDGAYVSLRTEDGEKLGESADEAGLAILENVPPGEYTMVVSASGFKDVKRKIKVSSESLSFFFKLERDD